jgi:hypothetical protein
MGQAGASVRWRVAVRAASAVGLLKPEARNEIGQACTLKLLGHFCVDAAELANLAGDKFFLLKSCTLLILGFCFMIRAPVTSTLLLWLRRHPLQLWQLDKGSRVRV